LEFSKIVGFAFILSSSATARYGGDRDEFLLGYRHFLFVH